MVVVVEAAAVVVVVGRRRRGWVVVGVWGKVTEEVEVGLRLVLRGAEVEI